MPEVVVGVGEEHAASAESNTTRAMENAKGLEQMSFMTRIVLRMSRGGPGAKPRT